VRGGFRPGNLEEDLLQPSSQSSTYLRPACPSFPSFGHFPRTFFTCLFILSTGSQERKQHIYTRHHPCHNPSRPHALHNNNNHNHNISNSKPHNILHPNIYIRNSFNFDFTALSLLIHTQKAHHHHHHHYHLHLLV